MRIRQKLLNTIDRLDDVLSLFYWNAKMSLRKARATLEKERSR